MNENRWPTWSACRPYSELDSEKEGERDAGASDREVPGAMFRPTDVQSASFFSGCADQSNEDN
jgi:hypothetical protein